MSLINEDEEEWEEEEYINLLFGKEDDSDTPERENLNNILKAKIIYIPNALSVRTLIEALIDKEYVIPDFQRRFVWKKTQVAKLALSLIKDVPIPPIYLYGDKNADVILDGQQRVTSMFLYFNNLWYTGLSTYKRFDFGEIDRLNKKVVELEKKREEAKKDKLEKTIINAYSEEIKAIYAELKKDHGVSRSKFLIKNGNTKQDITFSNFDSNEQRVLWKKRVEITLVKCSSLHPKRVYADIFKLLNSAGKLLGSQEIRNGIYYDSALYKDLFVLNQNPTWRSIYGNESQYYKDVEILLKMLALNHYTVQGLYFDEDLKENKEGVLVAFHRTFSWSNIMEEYSELYISSEENPDEKSAVAQLKHFFDCIINVKSNRKCNKAVFEAVFVAFCKLNINEPIDYSWICDLENEIEFQKGQVLSNKSSVQRRLTKAFEKMKEKYNA